MLFITLEVQKHYQNFMVQHYNWSDLVVGRKKRIKLKNIDSHTEDNIFKILNILIHNMFLNFQQAFTVIVIGQIAKPCFSICLCNSFFFFCNLFIFEEKQRQIQIQKHMTCIYNLHRRNTFNLSKQAFCNIKLKFKTPRTLSNVFVILMMIYSQCYT